MHDTGKGYNVGDPQKFLGALLQNAVTSGKDPSPKAKLPPVYLDLPATSSLIDSCTRKYQDSTQEHAVPEGGEHPAPEEHFVWLSKDYTPYENDPGSPFVPPDFTLGLPPVKDWPRQVGELPWVLDPQERPKPVRNIPVDSTSSMDKGKKKKKKKKHHHSKKNENPELKVTTRGEGVDTSVWAPTGSPKDSSSRSDSQSEGDSGLGSNPSFKPRQDTDTEPRRGATPRPSLDPTKEPADDDPLSKRGKDDGDQEMPEANQQGVDDPTGPGPAPREVPEEAQMGDDQMGADDAEEAQDPEEPREPEEPLELYEVMLQGFPTVTQTLSAAYGATCDEIQAIVWKSLAKTTAKDRTFVWGASGAIRQWLNSVKPAMDCTEKSVKDQAKLLAKAQKAGKDAPDSILELIPEEEGQPHLTPVFPKATHLLAPVLTVARRHTDGALRNIHTQLVDLGKEHIPQEHAGAFFNTILQVSCSFRQEMDNMAMNQVFLPCQIVPNLWGSHRGLLEGLSLLGPPSCSASWPTSLVERVTAIPACQNIPGSSKTPTKSNLPPPRVAKMTPDSGKKPHHSAKQVARLFWKDDVRGKEDAEARKLEEKHRKKSTGPVLSLGNHEESISNLLKRGPPSRVSQPPGKAPSSGSQHQEKARGKHIPSDRSDDDPLSDRADEPKAKNRKRDPTPD